MNKSEEKNYVKNYMILIGMFILIAGITIYMCNCYNVYHEYQKQTPVIRGYLSEITTQELDNFIQENPTSTLYLCTASNDACRNYEKKFIKIINKEELNDIIYLNIKEEEAESFPEEFNKKYQFKVSLKSNYPAFITFEDGNVRYILQGNKKEDLTISKTKQYFELKKVGE